MAKRKPEADPRLAALNAKNAEFWKKEQAKRDAQIGRQPRDAEVAAKRMARLAAVNIRAPESVESILKEYAEVRSADQSTRARGPRPDRRSSIRKAVGDAIRGARLPDERLADFLDRKTSGVTIIPCKAFNKNVKRSQWRFDILLPTLGEPWRVSRRLLQELWREAERAG